MVDSVDATMGLLGAVVMLKVFLRLLINTDVNLEVSHLLVYFLLAQAKGLNVDIGRVGAFLVV